MRRFMGVIPYVVARSTLPREPQSHFLPATAATGRLSFALPAFPRPVAFAFVRLSSPATILCDPSS